GQTEQRPRLVAAGGSTGSASNHDRGPLTETAVGALKEDLLRPKAYPEPRPSKIELAGTHISWVFLLDREVYKVKKPVELGFLDFRSLEQRKAACEAEARLNARLSPNVYRGVVPVRRDPNGQACIGGSGPIVDFAVHMVRLPDRIRAD